MSVSHSHIKDGPAQQAAAAMHSLQSESLIIAKTLWGDVAAFNKLDLRYQNLAFSVARDGEFVLVEIAGNSLPFRTSMP